MNFDSKVEPGFDTRVCRGLGSGLTVHVAVLLWRCSVDSNLDLADTVKDWQWIGQVTGNVFVMEARNWIWNGLQWLN